jgi:hypothetical protein
VRSLLLWVIPVPRDLMVPIPSSIYLLLDREPLVVAVDEAQRLALYPASTRIRLPR